MSTTLYRKYRPQTFDDLVGQEPVVQVLVNSLRNGNTAHAYLFSGTRGVGKTSIARILARHLVCTSPVGGLACGHCPSCTILLQGGNHIDVVEIDAASNTGVDNVRELIEQAAFLPSLGAKKVFIIDEVHMLSKSAFNALLKTLEEPPRHVVFILATTETHKVPATIISRTQSFHFKPLTQQQLVERFAHVCTLEGITLDTDSITLIAKQARGSVRDGLSILGQVAGISAAPTIEDVRRLLGLTEERAVVTLIDSIVSGSQSRTVELFRELDDQGTNFTQLNRSILEYLDQELRDRLSGSGQQVLVGLSELMVMIRLFLRSYKETSESPDPSLPLVLASLEASERLHKQPTHATTTSALPTPKPKNSPIAAPHITQVDLTRETSVAAEAREVADTTTHETAAITARDDSSTTEHASTSYGRWGVTRSEFELRWGEILEHVRGVNSPLATLLKNCPIVDITSEQLVLGVNYLFHKENLESRKNYALLQSSISKVFSTSPEVQFMLQKHTQDKVSLEDSISSALQVFGGEVIG